MQHLQGHVDVIEEKFSNFTIYINRQMKEVNFNVNQNFHKLEDQHDSNDKLLYRVMYCVFHFMYFNYISFCNTC